MKQRTGVLFKNIFQFCSILFATFVFAISDRKLLRAEKWNFVKCWPTCGWSQCFNTPEHVLEEYMIVLGFLQPWSLHSSAARVFTVGFFFHQDEKHWHQCWKSQQWL